LSEGKVNKKSIISVLIIVPAIILQAGCSYYEPMDPPYEDIPPGPGILTGEKGYYQVDLDR
jgi:hypothetical protein